MPLGALHQVHHFDRPVGGDEQLPLARPVSQAPLEVRPTALELLRIEGANRPRRQHQPHLAPRVVAPRVVAPRDRDGHLPLPGIGQTKTTSPRAIAPRVEQPHVVPPRPRAHHLVRLAKDTPRIAHVRPGLDVQLAAKPQPPAPLPVAQSPRQPLRQVPPLQIPHAQGHTRPRPHLERHRPVLLPRVVRAVNVHRPRFLGVIDDSQQPLANPVERRNQQGEGVLRLRPGPAPRTGGREVRQVTFGALHQVHHFDRPVGGDEQLPLARPVSQAPLEVRPTALELLRIEGANRPRRQHQPHLAPRVVAPRVVAPRDRDGHLPLPGIGQAKTASPRAIAPRVEQPHVVPPRPRGHHLVRLAKDTPRIAHIRPGLDVQLAVKP